MPRVFKCKLCQLFTSYVQSALLIKLLAPYPFQFWVFWFNIVGLLLTPFCLIINRKWRY